MPADCPCRRPRTLAVEVTVHTARQYRWGFGDGGAAEAATRGVPYGRGGPRSEIQHKYERSSKAYAQGFPVTMDVELPVSYAVTFEGETSTFDLGITTLRYGRTYPVQQLQSLLLAPESPLPR